MPKISHRRSGAGAGLGRKDEWYLPLTWSGPQQNQPGGAELGKRGTSLGGEGIVPALDKTYIVRGTPEADRYAGL